MNLSKSVKIFEKENNYEEAIKEQIEIIDLYKESIEIEKNIRKYMKQSKPTAPQLPPIPKDMYG